MKYRSLLAILVMSFPLLSQKMVKGENGAYSFINTKGEVIFENQIESYNYLSVSLDLNETFQHINKHSDHKRNFISIIINHKAGIINHHGEIVLPIEQDHVRETYSKDSLIIFRSANKAASVLDLKTSKTINTDYDFIENFYEGSAVYRIYPDKAGVINSVGEIVIPAQKQLAEGFSKGLMRVSRDGKDGFVDLEGKMVIPCKYDRASHFLSGFSVVNIGGKYDRHLNFKGGKYGIIDQDGQLYLDIEYDQIEIQDEHYFIVTKGNKQALFYTSVSELIMGFDFKNLSQFPRSDYWTHEIKGKKGVINSDGDEILPCIYDKIWYEREERIFRVMIGSKEYYVDFDNKRVD